MACFFSVLIPAYNAELFIGEAIESVLNQKDAIFEVIVVNDGSTDRTSKIVKGFGNHVKLITQPNSGVSLARNRGAAAAKGEALAFLDADDLWLPGKLRSQSRKLEEGYEIVYTNRINFGDRGDLPDVQTEIQDMPEGDIFECLLLGNVITNSSVVIRKNVFEALNGFNPDLLTCEDWDLWLRCALRHRIGFCPEPLVKYRFHYGRKSLNYRRQSNAREGIISSILLTDRGRRISNVGKRKVRARTFSTSAWSAAQSKDLAQVFKWNVKALWSWPFDWTIWHNIFRVLFGRVCYLR